MNTEQTNKNIFSYKKSILYNYTYGYSETSEYWTPTGLKKCVRY